MKNFLQWISNSRTNRIISTSMPEDVPEFIRFMFRTKHHVSVMMFVVVTSDGLKMPPIFIDSGVKINADLYIKILEDHVWPWITSNYNPDTKIVYSRMAFPYCQKDPGVAQKKHTRFLGESFVATKLPDLNPLN